MADISSLPTELPEKIFWVFCPTNKKHIGKWILIHVRSCHGLQESRRDWTEKKARGLKYNRAERPFCYSQSDFYHPLVPVQRHPCAIDHKWVCVADACVCILGMIVSMAVPKWKWEIFTWMRFGYEDRIIRYKRTYTARCMMPSDWYMCHII